MDMINIQKRVVLNKIRKKFNVGNIDYEFGLIQKELAEAVEAYQQKTNLGEELADIVLLCAGIAEMCGICLSTEIINKLDIIERRIYVEKNGILVKEQTK